MKLFFRDNLALIIVNIAQMIAVLSIYIMDGYRNYLTALYSLFIGICLLTAYLFYRYFTHKDFYKRLSNPVHKLDEVNEMLGFSPLPEALTHLLKSQHTQYMNELHLQERKRNDHLTFINQWVHQMKTPLSVIQLITQEEDDERFTSIQEEVDKIGKGLDMVLYAARLETFEHDFQVGPVNLRKIAEQAVSENKRLFIKNRVYPEIQIDPNIFVDSDEKWLMFTLNQLITNAVKYSAGKSQKIFIQGSQRCIEVRDNGIGIPKSDIKRVFNPFYTGENGRRYRESTGMGLYLVKEICDRIGHDIEVESEVGKGTTVKITFLTKM
ncbi:sensor histidine kinase [Lederbergia wuyishanensis]|uniref:histidine kinase n=1 Tax=Lederbergia wuyishanensis TaxID=1347903 RepID=A0ABU0DAY2_9BACI|nr:sensor histidine kinase [Lederbergia wuyishanensis]MCJ8010063.1 sensor histidine kinase [Lederbergia wuyishanensis]MDQ0345577.1 signal transduction histidine kinase [Lederbergia wuyishanensis]